MTTRIRNLTSLVLTLIPALTAAAARGAEPGALTVLPADGIQKRGDSAATWSFGQVEAIEASVLKRRFVVRNDTGKPQEIAYVQVSCGCATGTLEVEGSTPTTDSRRVTLAPGQKGFLEVTVDLGKLGPGPVAKYAWIYVQGRGEPAASFEMAGNLVPNLMFRPHVVGYGSVPYGKAPSVRLAALLDPRLVRNGQLPALESTNPNVRVTAAEPTAEERAMATRNADLGPGLKDRALVVKAYTAFLAPDTPIGPLEGNLSFASPFGAQLPRHGATARSDDGRLVGALTSVSAWIVGQVTGDVFAEPKQLAFSTVTAGTGATRSIRLTGTTPAAVEGLRISGQGAWLTTRPERATGASVNLEVVLKPEAPSSYLNERLIITLKNGQRLAVPVTALITQAPQVRK